MPKITEIKSTLAGQTTTFYCDLVVCRPDSLVVCYRLPAARELAGLQLPAGGLTLGYFWQHRPYNVYQFFEPQGQTLGWYCNICDQTDIDDSTVRWRDLVVDLLFLPGGGCHLLDREQLPENLPIPLAGYIESAIKQLRADWHELRAELSANQDNYLRLAQEITGENHD